VGITEIASSVKETTEPWISPSLKNSSDMIGILNQIDPNSPLTTKEKAMSGRI
jgi:hypothetical protein